MGIPYQVTVSGTEVARFEPDTDLAHSAKYYAEMFAKTLVDTGQAIEADVNVRPAGKQLIWCVVNRFHGVEVATGSEMLARELCTRLNSSDLNCGKPYAMEVLEETGLSANELFNK